MAKKILLSTDIGSDIDDALALNTMINSGINLKGIYTVNGDVKTRAYITRHMVDLSKKNISVCIGESQPLGGSVKPYSYFEDAYIDDKFIDSKASELSDNLLYKLPQKAGIESNGLEDLAKKLSKDKYTIFSMAPLTNIAKLIDEHPETIKNIEELYIMGCRFSDERIQEHNVRFDVPAAVKVFESDIPITVIPGNLCTKYKMPVSYLEQLNTLSGQYVKRMAKGFMATKAASEFRFNNLTSFIQDKMRAGSSLFKLDKIERLKKFEMKDNLIVNLNDSFEGAYDPEDYFKQYNELISHLKDPDLSYEDGKRVAAQLESFIPKTLSVADVYVPYCFLNKNKLKIEKSEVKINSEGISYMNSGDKHSVVIDLDFNDFQKFLKNNLR